MERWGRGGIGGKPAIVQLQTQGTVRHADHLNTPRLVADATGTTVWRWDQGEPFGNDVPNSNPSGAGTFDFPLRFPGQYFDRETNLAYNWMRDYDPSIGRYVQSDPVGLVAGLNTYLYVGGNPITYVDLDGLQQSPPFHPRAPRPRICIRWMCTICAGCPPTCTTFFVDAPPGKPGSGGFAGPGGYAGDATIMPECMCVRYAIFPL